MLSVEAILWLETQAVGKVVKVESFDNALTNSVFLITNSDNVAFIFKCLNQKARSQEDRQAEFLVQQLANLHGLTSKVIAHNQKYKLQQYIEGELICNQSVNLFQCLAKQLLHVHQLPALYAPKQRLAFELDRLYQQLQGRLDEAIFQKMLKLAEQLDQSSSKDTLCHGDLSLNNLLIGKDKQLYILDWEYAVIACPAYDLASCCCINTFNSDDSYKLIKHYYQQNTKKLTQSFDSLQKECDLYFQTFSYINELWSLTFLEKDN